MGRLYLETDHILGQHGNRVPDAGLSIDPDRIAVQDVRAGDLPGVVEREEGQFALKHDERFGLRGIAVPMRRDIRAPDHHVEEAMGVVVHAGMEVVVGAKARRLARAVNEGGERGRSSTAAQETSLPG